MWIRWEPWEQGSPFRYQILYRYCTGIMSMCSLVQHTETWNFPLYIPRLGSISVWYSIFGIRQYAPVHHTMWWSKGHCYCKILYPLFLGESIGKIALYSIESYCSYKRSAMINSESDLGITELGKIRKRETKKKRE